MIEKLNAIGSKALEDVQQASSSAALEQIRVSILGKKGALSEVLKGLGAVSAEERPKIGAVANDWKKKIEDALGARKQSLEGAALSEQLQKERIDISIPSRTLHRGALHPVTTTTRRIVEIFSRLGSWRRKPTSCFLAPCVARD
jgi:phenylalanyl-tRNA synthetase alpha chain